MEWGQGNMPTPPPTHTCTFICSSRNCFRLGSVEPPLVWRLLRCPEDVEPIMSDLLILASYLPQYKISMTARCDGTYLSSQCWRGQPRLQRETVSTNRKALPKFHKCELNMSGLD